MRAALSGSRSVASQAALCWRLRVTKARSARACSRGVAERNDCNVMPAARLLARQFTAVALAPVEAFAQHRIAGCANALAALAGRHLAAR